MPTSRPYHLTWLCSKVIELRPQSILDIGVGFGSKGMLFREYTDVWNGNMFESKVRIDGVEIFPEYITPLQRRIYDNIYIGDILKLVDSLPSYDLIYMGDVLEHIPKEQGLDLIDKLRKKSSTLIIVTPSKVSEQGSVYGNINESHVSQWYPADFVGALIEVLGNSMVVMWEQPEVYYCEGMGFYGERMKSLYKLKPYTGLKEEVLFMGLYFEQDYEVYKNHKGKRYVFWNGSDVSRLLGNVGWQKILKEYPAKHVCHNEQLRDELKSVGIKAEIKPLFFANVKDYPISFIPKEQLEVYINAHPGREQEYGVLDVYEVALQLPDVEFFVYGIEGKDTDNLKHMGWLDEQEADDRMSRHHVCLRLNEHDGLSQLVIKAGLWGHYVLTKQGVKKTIKVVGVEDIIRELEALKGVTGPRLDLRDYLLTQNLNDLDWLRT